MKRLLFFFFILISVTLTSCSQQKSTIDTKKSLNELLQSMIDTQPESTFEIYENDSDLFIDHVCEHYDIPKNELDHFEGIIAKSPFASADEIAILKINDDAIKKDDIISNLKKYTSARKLDFLGYAPFEADKTEQSIIMEYGNYIVFIICSSPQTAQKAFEECFTESSNTLPITTTVTVTPTPQPELTITLPIENENKEKCIQMPSKHYETAKQMYDNKAIVEAFKNKDASLLDDKQLAIYEKCCEVIQKLITDSMTDYEKELAIHDYLIQWASYDEAALIDEDNASKDSDNPYGLLIKQTSICSGYTTTFQLFMDLLDIPCISIQGNSFVFGVDHLEDHAWNMVQLEGDWYYVDITWDDQVYGDGKEHAPSYTFFNVNNTMMEITGHRWNADEYPYVKNYFDK